MAPTWEEWTDASMAAMASVLGQPDDMVLHAVIPFEFGFEAGGAADVVSFGHHVDGIAYVTSELIGRDDQISNTLGNYELMICHRQESDWGPDIISKLAYYTRDAQLEPGHSMDLGPSVPEGATIGALLFLSYAAFEVLGRKAGFLLCIGITADELAACQARGHDFVAERLKAAGVYPFTDLYRSSVLTSS